MERPVASRREIRTFRSLLTLRVLNVLAVGSSLAGGTGALFASMGGAGWDDWFASASAFSTLVFGLGWAALLRDRRTVGGTKLRWGWLASIPLAIGNAATACAMLIASKGAGDAMLSSVVTGALIGATFGAIIWVPGLIATLVAFGLPIAWAQKRAAQGLAGEERGEVVIGVVSSLASFVALLLLFRASLPHSMYGGEYHQHASPVHLAAISVLAFVGLLSGLMASAFAAHRAGVRRKFVREVEAGAVPGFRVDPTPEGKVLIRVTSMGSGYRVANFEEHLAVLDETGEARRGQST